ncbi:DUF4279 domain-containing protein, partial [Cytobacillus firmus]
MPDSLSTIIHNLNRVELFDDVTEKLEVTHTETHKKGDLIPNCSTACYRKETKLGSRDRLPGFADVNNQLQQIINKLHNKSSIINEIKEAYSVECKLSIVVKIEG